MNTLLQIARRTLDKTPHAARNTIPPITDPMGKHWEQPDPSRFVITDERVAMSRADFDKLHDYSHSQPTGTYPGKCWKLGGYEKGTPFRLFGGFVGSARNLKTTAKSLFRTITAKS